MTALRNPLLEAASVRPLFACTTCARRLMDKGLAPLAGSIDFGTLCECHPVGQPSIYATSIVSGPASEVTTPVDVGAAEDDDAPESYSPIATLPRRIDVGELVPARVGAAPVLTHGPVPSMTEIATRLVVAWSTSERVADSFLIDAAVKAARDIVKKTGGA